MPIQKEFPAKVHSRRIVTSLFKKLNDCIIHNSPAVIEKVFYGDKRNVAIVIHCEASEECCIHHKYVDSGIATKWNKRNPITIS